MRPAGPGRSSSRLGGWNSGLTEESPCGSATRWCSRSGSTDRWWGATTPKPSGRGIDGCKNPETAGLVLLPPSEEGFEAPGLRRLPWWTVGSTPAGRADARIEEVDGRRGSDSQPAEPPLPKRPPPEPSKPTRSWLGNRRPPERDKAPTSENPPASGGFRKTSSGSANHASCQTAVWKGKRIAATKKVEMIA